MIDSATADTVRIESGIDTCRKFYRQHLRPILESTCPGLPHAAALLGRGSEVLGFDDAMSADHNYEARATIFLDDQDHKEYATKIGAAFRRNVPAEFEGRPTDWQLTTPRDYLLQALGIDVAEPIAAADWLTMPESNLLMTAGGTVFADEIGLATALDPLRYYPRDVWLYLMMAGWWRIHPEGNLVGRTGYVGDELGSAVIGTSVVSNMMRLCFLLERRYAPYSKWFGTAFSRLKCGPTLTPILTRSVRATTWQDREEALNRAYVHLGEMHNALQLTTPVEAQPYRMWDRPFTVVWGDYPGALRAELTDPDVIDLAERWPVGGVDGIRDILFAARFRPQLRALVG